MKISNIRLNNFRCFRDLELNFNDKYTVLLGINGAGKSTILDIIAIALGAYVSGFDNLSSNSIHQEDAHYEMYEIGSNIEKQPQFPVEIIAKASINNKSYKWKRELKGKGRKTTIVDAKEIRDYANELQKKVREGNKSYILPIVAYYGTGRLWMQKRRRVIKKSSKNFSRLTGYVDSLDAASNEKLMISWFEKMTLIQLSEGKIVPELNAVKEAMNRCYLSANPQVKDVQFTFNIKTNEIEIVTHYETGEVENLPMKLLSDGIKGAISLVADIAYRMATLNGQLLDRVLETPGVILVDEIDMHLHPEWQKKIIKDLTTIFPNVQFMFTTHSPSIVSNVPAENILILDDYKVFSPQNTTYGRDINSILREIMRSEVRPLEVIKLIKSFYDNLDEENLDKARKNFEDMKKILGENDAEVIQAQVHLDVEEL